MSSTSGMQQRQNAGKAKAEDDPLAKLSDDASAEPLDEQEQEAVIKKLRESNEKSNYIFRGLMLSMLGLVAVLYLTPIPDYIAGTHPESHLTMLFHPLHLADPTHEDMIHLPAFPFYLLFLSMQGALLFGAIYETAEKMGLVKAKGVSYPQQPHLFGTAPNWLAPILSDIRGHQSPVGVGVRADGPEHRTPAGMSTMSPRLLYLCVLTFTSFPLPLLTFGAGSFANAGWWAITTAVMVVLCICEHMIDKHERASVGLNGMKYSYKGA